ncbi:hypothetical protein DH2020_038988 [Rehmannia glutinosa]|uniref:Uncharacterized protein n=1 Tax=Rehmannia glutinosa TaxID=99300 RepID=A0ABR0UXA6_REHGL
MEIQSYAEHNNGEVDHSKNVQVITLQEFNKLLESQPRKWHPGSERRRQIHKVPQQIRLRVGPQSEHLYDPELVSLGPYHHGKPELHRAEEFKYLCLDSCSQGDEEKKVFLYNKVLKKIDVIRDCYAEVTIIEKYDDKALALMMLLDACFIINFMQNCTSKKKTNFLDWLHCLGMAASTTFTTHDILLLENQIPFQVLKLLITLLFHKEGNPEELLQSYLSLVATRDFNLAKIPRENEEPPIHFLEACWRVSVEKYDTELNRQERNQFTSKFQWWPRFLTRGKEKKKHYGSYTPCRSVMDLKAKGIHFKPSSSCSLMDITFKSRAFNGQLCLPFFFANMIAYEVSPNRRIKPAVLSYAIFMKSLIQSPADVKELQERGILLNTLGDYEQVVKVFKEVDTFRYRHLDVFGDVRQRVEEHCRSSAKTWIADLIHARFQSPWTAIALFAAIFLLCLTFLQTYFTIFPVKR